MESNLKYNEEITKFKVDKIIKNILDKHKIKTD
jgi:hypothetical protein